MTASLPAPAPAPEPAGDEKRDRRILRWLLLGLLAVLGLLYLAGYFFTGDRIARGTTIEGVDVGGKSPTAAVTALEVMPGLDRDLTLQAGRAQVTTGPAALGIALDAQSSVDQVAVGRSWDPRDMWEFVLGGEAYDAVLTVDEADLAAAIAEVGEKFDRDAREAAIGFRIAGERAVPEPVSPRPGRAVEVTSARDAVLAAYPTATGEPVVLPTVTVEPQVSETELATAMEEFANPAVSAPVAFRIAGERVVLEPEEFAPTLSVVSEDGALRPKLRAKRLLAVVEPKMASINLAPTDATVRIVDGAPQVVPGENGVSFDSEAITDGFLELVTKSGRERTMRVRTEISTPEFTAAEVRELGIKEMVSEFTTFFPYAEYRNINIGRAAELINGTVLKPGETFSLNGIVGERTAENGFVRGFIIADGIFRQELGGGVSQVATTAFNAAFFAGLKDVEHKAHSFYISRYPVGREATVAWPTIDLKFQNDTEYGVLVEAFRVNSTPSSQGSLTVRLWSTKTWDIEARASERFNFTSPATRRIPGDDCEPNEGYGGFDINVFRDFYRPGSRERVKSETIFTRYTPSDTVICTGDADDTD